MKYFLVLGSTNEVLDYHALHQRQEAAVRDLLLYVHEENQPIVAGRLVSRLVDGMSRRAMYLIIEVDEAKFKEDLYVLVRSVPYLHNSTRARVFYEESSAKLERDLFNAAVSRTIFHAYLFTFSNSTGRLEE